MSLGLSPLGAGASAETADVLKCIVEEAVEAQARFGDYASMHEAYGVLAEEVAELFDAVRLRQNDANRPVAIRHEAIQVAAVALRIAHQSDRVLR